MIRKLDENKVENSKMIKMKRKVLKPKMIKYVDPGDLSASAKWAICRPSCDTSNLDQASDKPNPTSKSSSSGGQKEKGLWWWLGPILKAKDEQSRSKSWKRQYSEPQVRRRQKMAPVYEVPLADMPPKVKYHTFSIIVLGNVTNIPIFKDDIPEDYDYSHFEYINKVFLS